MSAPQRYPALRFIVLFLAALSFLDLFAMLGVVGAHAYSPEAVQTSALAPMTFILAGSAAAAVLLGLLYSLVSYPTHRGTILLLVLVVGAAFAAHLYTINTPPLATGGSISGAIGSSVKDDHVTLLSELSKTNLTVIVADTGSGAIGSLSVTVGNVTLPGSGFASQPTYTQALQPGGQDRGTWSLPSAPSGRVTLAYQYLTCYATDKQVDGCVMDEVYYVPAAQTLLAGEKCAPYADNCNLEHPFLSKAFIAAGMAIFGNDVFGWRIFNVILGVFSIPLLFGICWSITRNARLSLYASYLLAFETLFFVHSSIAVIDVGTIFFAFLGFLFYFAKLRWWKFDSYTLAAVAFGLAALSKETAIMLLLVLVGYNFFLGEGSRRLRLFTSLEILLAVFLVFAIGLQVYDSLFGSGAATNFLGQIDFILKYGASLTGPGWKDTVLKTAITPLNWMTYYSPIGYLVTTVNVNSPSSAYAYISVGYYGLTNQFEVWLTYLWGAYVVYLWRKTKKAPLASEAEARDFGLAKLALVWFLIVFFAYVLLFLYGRVTYPYYFIQAIPAVAMGCAYFLSRSWFPNVIAYIVLIGVFAWFFMFYPDKAFLPDPLRVLIGH